MRKIEKNFKEVFNYKHCTLLRKEGLFLSGEQVKVITLDDLPDDIHVYYVQKRPYATDFSSFSINPIRNTMGICFLKEPFSFHGNQKTRSINKKDEFLIGESLVDEEEFFGFFGVRLSLDKQISLADESRIVIKEEAINNSGSDSEIGEEMDDKEFVALQEPENNKNS